jgi:hypothetical protein
VESPTSPHLNRQREVVSNLKRMLVISFDFEDTVQQAFVYPSQMVNQNFYQEVMQRLREQIC